MEKKFKVGDRVRHEEYGTGTVDYVNNDHGRCNVILDDNDVLANVMADTLTLLHAPAPTPDRAMIAAIVCGGYCANQYTPHQNPEHVAKYAVEITDALIAELQRPKQ